METMGSLRRTNYCGEVSMSNVGQEMTVCGSIARARDKGGIIFADLRDTTGILQLVFDEDTPKDVFAKAESLKSEYVVICRGLLRERAAKTTKIATGDVELYVSELRILSEAQTPPFEIRDDINVNDDLRLRYRYLDLRRPSMHEPIVLRSKIMQIIRSYFCDNHFTEIETPTLIKSTPEGARDYLVPSRVQPGHFYALPQSPQLYKQILMLSGFDRYFQIARCYRDEDLRADRQPEFTQVDEEMSFVNEDDIMTINEGLIKRLWKEMLGVDVQTPFVRMPWDEAMGRFGSDKPDTRFGLEIVDVTDIFDGTEFKPFAAVLEQGGSIRAINAKGLAGKLTRKHIDKLGEVAKTYGAKGLAFSRLTEEGTSSSFEKFLTEEEKAALYKAMELETGDVLLIVSDADWVKACTALGQVRLEIGRKYGLIDPDKFNFLWVVDFPLFEYSEQEGRWMAMHHPFTLPKAEDIDKVETDPGACHAVAYDIVLNGVEMGGGSMRINDPALQDRMFKALGFTEEKARESFGFLMDAYKFGAPPHGGMAYGLDRMVMLMLKKDSIRDVILFPTMKPLDSDKKVSKEVSAPVEATQTAPVVEEKIDFSNVQIEPLFEDQVDFDTFSKSDFRAVKVKECEAVKKSKKLLKFVLDDGTGVDRVILSGIHEYYEPEELVGKTCIAITNLPPRAMMGIDSCGMLISAVHHENGEEKLHLLMVDPHIPAGAKLY